MTLVMLLSTECVKASDEVFFEARGEISMNKTRA